MLFVVSVLAFSWTSLAQNGAFPNRPVNAAFIDRIHQGDLIEIRVSGYSEYDWRGGLNAEGFLDGFDRIPASVFARCKSVRELEQQINKILSESLRNPNAEIKIIDRSRRQLATIDGAVRNAQRMQLRRTARLSEIVINAGGLSDRASGQVIISRPAGASCINYPDASPSQRFDIALADLLSGKPDSNPVIVSGDLIVVIEASPVYLLGAVQGQGRIDYRQDLTVSRAVNSAGGLAKNANASQVKIFRRNGEPKLIAVDLAEIREKKSEDVVLKPFDIIDIPFKGRPPRKLPPIIDNESDLADRRAKLPTKVIE